MDSSCASAAFARADSARLASLPQSQALRFHRQLTAAGYPTTLPVDVPDVLEARSRGGRNLPRLLHATAAGTPLDVFSRLFLLGVPAPVMAARAAMTEAPLEEWCDAGLVVRDGDSVRSLVTIQSFEGLLLASDKSELLELGTLPDHVGAITNSTVSLVAFMVRRPCRTVLDLGTGCGALGFLAAREGGRLLATDVNPRAVQFASFNARLNGISNAEFAVGSGFDPAKGRKFDLILSNPPCVLGPAARYAYRDSGLELDALCRQLVAAAPDYLEEGGLFQCTAEWPDFARSGWEVRPSEWLRDTPCDALVLHIGESTVVQHCETTVCETDVLDLAEQIRLYAEFAAYFENRGVTSISEGLLALRRRSAPGRKWLRFEGLLGRKGAFFGDAVARYFSVSDTVESLGDRLFDLKPRMAPALAFLLSRTWTGDGWEQESYEICQGLGFRFKASVDKRIAELIERCDGARTLRELVGDLAASAGVPADAIAAGCLEVMGQLLRRGFLVL